MSENIQNILFCSFIYTLYIHITHILITHISRHYLFLSSAVAVLTKHCVIDSQCLLSLSLSLRQKASPPDSSQPQGGGPKPEVEVR